ncbi:Uncharacterised protein [Mycobacteroides abscessus subsp. massiliense]|nr:Uncharacterised protein [Mycobacteroides abscessus subsp. massiliense]
MGRTKVELDELLHNRLGVSTPALIDDTATLTAASA